MTRVKLMYAVDGQDIVLDELGAYDPMDLDGALKIAKRLLEGKYLMVRIVKLEGGDKQK